MSADLEPTQPVLYHHIRRPEWGLAILCGEDKTSRKYQFEDGRSRTFKEGFYELMQPAERDEDEAEEIVAKLNQALDRAVTRTRIMERAKKEGRNIFTVADQLSLFQKQFPGGFQDSRYLEEVREGGGGRRRKKNRQAAVDYANELLGQHIFDELLDRGDYATLFESAIEVLSSTDIASTGADIRPLRKLSDAAVADFIISLRDVLFGEDSYAERFSSFLAGIESNEDTVPTWPMATVIQGLVLPQEHFCIKPSVYRQQARWLAPELSYTPNPTAAQYLAYQAMGDDLRKRLEKAGLKPADNIDVYNFIWETMRPGVRKDLEAAKR